MRNGSTLLVTPSSRERRVAMDLRTSGAPRQTGAVTTITDPEPYVQRAVDRFVGEDGRGEVLAMLGLAVAS